MLVKTVSSEEARTHLRDVMDEVTAGKAEIVIERHGKPTVAVISYKEYQRLQNERAQQASHQRKGEYAVAANHTSATTGPYADYWNQFIGAAADEVWERPTQDELEQREVW